MTNAGRTVIGYVATGYGHRNVTAIRTDIDRWYSFYPNIQGIFFDETSISVEDVDFYQNQAAYLRTKQPKSQAFFNPGTSNPEDYVNQISNSTFVVFEGTETALLNVRFFSGWIRAPCYNFANAQWKYRSAAIVHTSSNYQVVVDTVVNYGIGWVYVTDDVMPNPYDVLPSYWANLMSYISSKNRATESKFSEI
eukprot:TRINITY_DN2336_c0_g1_i2.p1 TRINITY_DN2336_c0_g1~~TRINITY_DN2336_c0_g1_i2.p1  ORF type:complete len:194 (+),score=26.16 TRINITY_DN2336_c0_g1_i2:844-1425(+)